MTTYENGKELNDNKSSLRRGHSVRFCTRSIVRKVANVRSEGRRSVIFSHVIAVALRVGHLETIQAKQAF